VLRPSRRRIIDDVRFAAKRALDVVFSMVLLLIVAPALGAIALAIKLDSRGPVFFVQERVGSRRVRQGGRVWWEPSLFRCLKFRTMREEADHATHESYIRSFVRGDVEPGSDDDASYKLADDDRITRVGRILRQTSLDELPQLVNVLRGEMSLVGPRPVPVYEVAEYELWHYERLAALPGITGHWQVHGRGRTTFAEMMKMDLHYVRRPSIFADLRLLLATVPVVLARKGAR
jgi:lipopolysaccharide/colanic/teichoic acid biosynthesis glycosyltransferase